MKRCFKKAVAFGLALSMFASCMVVSAEENAGNGIAVIEDAVYDEAVSFSDSIVLLENGHWAEVNTDETTGEKVISSDVTEETKLIFYDANGNKKVISNKDANGGKLFDAVYPAITDIGGISYVKLIKGDSVAYLNSTGESIGEEGKFYKDCWLVRSNALLVTKDGVNYKVAGIPDAQEIEIGDIYNCFIKGDILDIRTKDKIIIAKTDGTLIKEFPITDKLESYTYLYDNGAFSVSIPEKSIVYNSKHEELFEVNTRLYATGKFQNDNYLLMDGWEDDTNKLIDSRTGEIIFECKGFLRVDNERELFVTNNLGGNPIIYYIDGNVIDLKESIDKIIATENLSDVEYELEYQDGYLIITLKGYNNGLRYVNYIFSSESKFELIGSVRIEGRLYKLYPDKNTIITRPNSDYYIENIYTLDGSLVKSLYSDTGIEYNIQSSVPRNWPGLLDVVSHRENDKYIYSIMNLQGDLTGSYTSAMNTGEILIGDRGEGEIEVVNYFGDVVHKESGALKFYGRFESDKVEKIYGLSNNHYFGVNYKDGTCKLFDYEGNEISGLDGYSGIGPCETVSVPAYAYVNDDLGNGLCVTRKTDADGNYKYGVIKFNVVLEKGDCNGDKAINAQDALAVLKHAAKISILPDESVGEVTGDGLVNAQDALKILKLAAHIIDSLD